MRYYSINVVHADNEDDAVKKVMLGDFDESHPLCDRVLTYEYLQYFLKRLDETEQ